MSKYSAWLKQNYADGTLRVSDGPSAYVGSKAIFTVEPYFASMALYWAFKASPDEFKIEVAGWLTFWLNNRSSKTGSCLVHYCTADRSEIGASMGDLPANKEDATDSNIAMWYLLLDAFTSRYGFAAFSREAQDAMHEPLLALYRLHEPDGMTWAKADYKIKYLMDNVEVVAGLGAAERVLARNATSVLAQSMAGLARDLRQRTASAVGSLRNHMRDCWMVQKDATGAKHSPDMKKAYPDVNCQVWPGIFGVGISDGLAIVEQTYPNWTRQRISQDTMTDVHVALAAKVSGRHGDVRQWLQTVAPSYESGSGFAWPFTAAEAGMMHYIVMA